MEGWRTRVRSDCGQGRTTWAGIAATIHQKGQPLEIAMATSLPHHDIATEGNKHPVWSFTMFYV